MRYRAMRTFSLRPCLRWTVGFLCVVRLACSQGSPSDAKSVLQLPESEQRQFVISVLDAGFPEKDGDRLSLLLVNRSALVIPILESRIELELKRPQPSERLIGLASAMIAYSGDEVSLRAISSLVRIDEGRFGDLVGRTLDNAGNWRNPFTVVYRAVEMGDPLLVRKTTAWVDVALSADRLKRAWGEAMLDRYGRVPVDADWSKDPIASRLKNGTAAEVRQRVTTFATEAREKRK